MSVGIPESSRSIRCPGCQERTLQVPSDFESNKARHSTRCLSCQKNFDRHDTFNALASAMKDQRDQNPSPV